MFIPCENGLYNVYKYERHLKVLMNFCLANGLQSELSLAA